MKIRLLEDLPIAHEHGAVEGLEIEAEMVPVEDRIRNGVMYHFVSPKTGEKIGVLKHEAEICEQ